MANVRPARIFTGLIGGLLFGVTLWFDMSYAIPRADNSALWGINYALATYPIGIRQLSWLFTGNTLMVPLILLSMALFAVEGDIAGGAAPGTDLFHYRPSNTGSPQLLATDESHHETF